MIHKHKASLSPRIRGFSACVRPCRCNPAAHGCVEVVDECRCGATRSTLVNGNHVERGLWSDDVRFKSRSGKEVVLPDVP